MNSATVHTMFICQDIIIKTYNLSLDKGMPRIGLFILNSFVFHGLSVISNFSPIIGHMMKNENTK